MMAMATMLTVTNPAARTPGAVPYVREKLRRTTPIAIETNEKKHARSMVVLLRKSLPSKPWKSSASTTCQMKVGSKPQRKAAKDHARHKSAGESFGYVCCAVKKVPKASEAPNRLIAASSGRSLRACAMSG